MPIYPSNVPTGRIHGRYAFLWQDSIDAGTQPDLTPVSGQVRLRCTATQPMFFRQGADPALGLIVRDHILTFNADGDLVDLDGTTMVDLLATDSTLVTPKDFQWEAEFELVVTATSERLYLPKFRFNVPEGQDVDLVSVTPISSSGGVPIIQGPTGPATKLTTGVITTLAPGSPVTAGLRGVPGDQILDLGIPQGVPGEVQSVAGRVGAIVLTKSDVGLPNVDNTSDAGKPVSTATQTALDGKAPSVHRHTHTDIDGTVPNNRLPTRLMEGASNVLDWNDAATNGWRMGYGALNAPEATGWFIGDVVAHNALWITQTVYAFTSGSSVDSKMWRRSSNDPGTGVRSWGAWYRLRISEAELDARFAKAAHTHTSGQVTDFVEAVQDTVAALAVAGAGVGLTYDDVAGTLTITATGGAGATDPEIVRDTIGTALRGSGAITVTVDDIADTITISVAVATATAAGIMSGTDKAKLDGSSASASPSSLVQRDDGGSTRVSALFVGNQPSAVDQATRKDYVDAQVATRASKIAGAFVIRGIVGGVQELRDAQGVLPADVRVGWDMPTAPSESPGYALPGDFWMNFS